MSVVEEVREFTREYINNPGARSSERKAKIREAYRLLTGKRMNASCSTCYIESLLKIKNLTEMASNKYELRKGVVLQVFGDPSKTCTNDTITDALGDYFIANHPEKLKFFTKYPKVAPKPVAQVKEKEPVKEVEVVADINDLPDEAQAIVAAVSKPKRAKKSK